MKYLAEVTEHFTYHVEVEADTVTRAEQLAHEAVDRKNVPLATEYRTVQVDQLWPVRPQ